MARSWRLRTRSVDGPAGDRLVQGPQVAAQGTGPVAPRISSMRPSTSGTSSWAMATTC